MLRPRRTPLLLGATLSVAGVLAIVAGCGFDATATGDGLDPSASESGTREGAIASDALPDALSDGSTDVPVGTPDFCARQAKPFLACWDFDLVAPGGDPGFTDSLNAGTLDVVDEQGNHALRFTLPSATGSRASWVRYGGLAAIGSASVTYDVTFAFSIRSSTIDYAAIGALFLYAGGTRTLGVASYGRGSLLDGIPTSASDSLASTPGAAWHTARIRLTGDQASMKETVSVDAVGVDSTTVSVGPSGLDLRLGTFFTSVSPAGGIDVVFDDIVVRVQ